MPIIPIFDPKNDGRPMQVAAFMSGLGTNTVKLIEYEKKLKKEKGSSPFEVVFILSDRLDGVCAGKQIALENGLPYFSYDIRSFHKLRALKRTVKTSDGLMARREYDQVAKKLVKIFEIDVIALGGYMSYITLDRCINVHPADLTIHTVDGERKYIGDNAVYDAILAGEEELRASTLWTDSGVDSGPVLIVSKPIQVELPEPLEILVQDKKKLLEVSEKHQEQLKKIGDWEIFPRTIEMIAEGRFALNADYDVYVDGFFMPDGYRGI